MARPKGSTNIEPTSYELKNAKKLLKDKAAEGDVNAAGWLLKLNHYQNDRRFVKSVNGRLVETR